MNKNKLAFASLIILFVCNAFTTSNCTVSFNGIYAYKLDNEHSAVLRFFEDGTVLASTSVNDYFDVMTWFTKENKDRVLKGKYKIKKCEIFFDVEGDTGKQSYQGVISGNSIQFKLTDKQSKKSTDRTYIFVAL